MGGGAYRAVPQEVPVEDFDEITVVQSLVLPDSHLQPGVQHVHICTYAHATCHMLHATTCTCTGARARTGHMRPRTCMHGTRTACARPMHSIYVRASLRLTKVPFCERSCSQASQTGWRSRGARCGVAGGRGHTIQWYKRMCRLEMYGMGLRGETRACGRG